MGATRALKFGTKPVNNPAIPRKILTYPTPVGISISWNAFTFGGTARVPSRPTMTAGNSTSETQNSHVSKYTKLEDLENEREVFLQRFVV